MKRRAVGFAWAIVVAFVMQQFVIALPLAVQSWNERREISCDWPGVPFEYMDGCRFGLAMSEWGKR